jgi:hypothetical protein
LLSSMFEPQCHLDSWFPDVIVASGGGAPPTHRHGPSARIVSVEPDGERPTPAVDAGTASLGLGDGGSPERPRSATRAGQAAQSALRTPSTDHRSASSTRARRAHNVSEVTRACAPVTAPVSGQHVSVREERSEATSRRSAEMLSVRDARSPDRRPRSRGRGRAPGPVDPQEQGRGVAERDSADRVAPPCRPPPWPIKHVGVSRARTSHASARPSRAPVLRCLPPRMRHATPLESGGSGRRPGPPRPPLAHANACAYDERGQRSAPPTGESSRLSSAADDRALEPRSVPVERELGRQPLARCSPPCVTRAGSPSNRRAYRGQHPAAHGAHSTMTSSAWARPDDLVLVHLGRISSGL